MGLKLWLDDLRQPPDHTWNWVRSVWGAVSAIKSEIKSGRGIDMMSLDHDLGDYARQGGDGIKLLVWMIEHDVYCPVMLHTMNPVGRENMARIIKRYWPPEYYRL